VKYLKTFKGCSSKKVTWLTAQLKRLYTNTHSMATKQEELEATVLLESYSLVAITALYVKKRIECEELSLKNSHEQLESL